MDNKDFNVFKRLRMEYPTKSGQPLSLRGLEALFDKKVAFTHISDLEHGNTPSLAQLKTYHDFFNVSYDYLLGATSDKNYDNFMQHKDIIQTIDYISKSNDETDQKISEVLENLLTTDKGYAILFYLSKYLNDEISGVSMAQILNTINTAPVNEDYTMLRLRVENKVKE